MTQKVGELTEVPLGDVVAVQQPKKSTNSGQNVVMAILAIVVAAALNIGVLSAAGVDFSSSNTSKAPCKYEVIVVIYYILVASH